MHRRRHQHESGRGEQHQGERFGPAPPQTFEELPTGGDAEGCDRQHGESREDRTVVENHHLTERQEASDEVGAARSRQQLVYPHPLPDGEGKRCGDHSTCDLPKPLDGWKELDLYEQNEGRTHAEHQFGGDSQPRHVGCGERHLREDHWSVSPVTYRPASRPAGGTSKSVTASIRSSTASVEAAVFSNRIWG